ncbi:hypothetical protein [Candidatus Entotheonella palauensis]|uniref:Uncharacterized protein n=1 Tax=Candidatus Entotheonella gemina TaxID=1429439 RepID=W4MBT9_9BACT|nr:hypothetical protein [Candidatus Entotheonella palauensis]ETX07117.1 MAG: hypothetical protein ETSY2_13120 [Candidatus Entotheonella gemina]
MTDNRDDLKAEAQQFGLTHLNDHQLAQLAKAKAAAQRMIDGIPRDLHAYDEPAHVYRASEETSS